MGKKEIANDRFQGMCLYSEEGSQFMTKFDRLPWIVRERLRNSPFNICVACVREYAYRRCYGHATEREYIETIEMFEHQIRCQAVQ